MRWLAPISAVTIAIAFACFAGVVDQHNDEVQATVLIILAGGTLAGAIVPRFGWLLGMVVSVGVPIAHYRARAMGFPLPYPVSSPQAPWLALIPGLIAGCVGMGLGYGLRSRA